MKKAFVLMIACLAGNALLAQKCLQLDIAPQSSRLLAASQGATSFGDCNTRKNDHGQTEITDYGTAEQSLKDYLQKTDADFTSAQMGTQMGSMQMAAQMQSMTDAQRQAYAQQMAAQMRANVSAQQPAMTAPDNSQNVKLAMQAYTIATTQMPPLNNELAAKARELQTQQKNEEDAIKQPDISQCPAADKEGLPSCGCANSKWQSYWQQILALRDNYASKKAALLQQYKPKLKALAAQVDEIVVKLKYGDALNNPQYKKMLASAQSGAFNSLFAISESVAEDARHGGADAYVNLQNAKANVYFLGCEK